MPTQQAQKVPFGARAAQPPYTVLIDPSQFTYDSNRQVNVTADGGLWANTPMAASSTATNNDGTGGPDEAPDPYAFPDDQELGA